MVHQPVQTMFLTALMTGVTLGSCAIVLPNAIAQIIPDQTLGGERSIINLGLPEQGLIDRIDGGAIRGSNLFHSFSELNVNSGQRVYFANPATIRNIISRVTGNNASNIDGTLGVLGNANLFLINPNGIVFGPNAKLDMRGSFFASTGDRLELSDGYTFSAIDPTAPPLLAITAPLGLTAWLPSRGTVTNTGNLSVGGDLTLVGQNLNLQGQIQAGQNLNLLATDSLTIRDTATSAFIASAGNRMLLQGNQLLDISALNNPNSGLLAGGEMVLRSDAAIVTDAYFTAGGNFRTERLDGSPGSVISVDDPVFEVGGDFAIADYTGASLQIFAGGSITIPGTITINAAGGPFNDGTVPLSNGRLLTLSGTTQPTLDIRAGTTGFVGTPTPGTPTGANITIGSIINNGGVVFLTNQFAPNSTLVGDIQADQIDTSNLAGGGSVIIDSRGKITTSFINTSGSDTTPAGEITLLAKGDILLPFVPTPTFIVADGLRSGSITMISETAIIQEFAPFGTPGAALSTIQAINYGAEAGGDVTLTAPNLVLGGNIFPVGTLGTGQSGNIRLTATTLTSSLSTIATVTAGPGNAGEVIVKAPTISLDYAFLGSASSSDSGARGGNVTLEADSITGTTGSQIASLALGFGDAGDVTIKAQTISLSGFTPGDLNPNFQNSAIISSAQLDSVGNSGKITITTGKLTLSEGAAVATSSFGVGNAGDILINASELVSIDGAVFVDFAVPPDVQPSGITSELFTGAVGKGGNITINTAVLQATNGGTITALSDGDGDAGSITIDATQSVLFDGVASFAAIGQRDRISQATVVTEVNSTGQGGTLTVKAPNLTLTNGGQLSAETRGAGNAGNVVLNINQTLAAEGAGSGIFASTATGSTGDGGSISITKPEKVTVQDGAAIAVNSQGSGTAGNLSIESRNLVLQDQGTITAETVSNTGGDITLQIDDVIVMRDNSRISTSAGTAGAGGDGGNITINTQFLVAEPTENSDITANAFTGRGGRVDITAEGIFGFFVLSRSQLETALGTSDPSLLNPAFLPTSDITAISQVNPNLNGEVVIRSPNPDPSRGALPLPPEIVDASRLIARDCSAGGAIAQRLGSLIVTGQGGLPPSPSDQLRGNSLLIGWENLNGVSSSVQPTVGVTQTPQTPTQLVEVQALQQRSDGQVVLVAHDSTGSNQEFWNRPPTCRTTPP